MARATSTNASNSSLAAAKEAKNDEFYTQLEDIESEMRNYRTHFRGKTVFCNCDDPEWSNFWVYFTENFAFLGLKKVVATHYANGEPSYVLEFVGQDEPLVRRELIGDGDFRSPECIEILRSADVVVTNPPFSLFREYVTQLMEHEKKFLIIGNHTATTYKDFFELIQTDKVWQGVSPRSMTFRCPDGTTKAVNACWFTNLPHNKRNDELILTGVYSGNERRYPKYVNYDAIEVGRVENIPADYNDAMGVPITFLEKYNPEQFEILGSSLTLGVPMSQIAPKGSYSPGGPRFYLDNGDGTYKRMFDRVVIKRR